MTNAVLVRPGARLGRANAVVKVAIAATCVLWMLPIFGLLVTSLRPIDDANDSGWWTIFTNPGSLARLTLDNYQDVLSRRGMGAAFVNSLAISLPSTFIPLVIAAFTAYAFTFLRFPGRDLLYVITIGLLLVPNQLALVPLLKLYGSLHMIGSFPAAWLFHASFGLPLAIYILRTYMSTLPKEIIEAAKVDGASHFTIFWRLVVPMSVPALAAFAIFQFLWTWNDFLVALVFIGPGDNQPLTLALNALLGQLGEGWQLLTAGGFFTMLLPLTGFLVLQRFFVRGLTAGAVNG